MTNTPSNVRIIIANNPEALSSVAPTHSIEAEFGDVVVEGSVLTLAHHGPRSGNPAPCEHCATKAELVTDDSDAVVSHFDLDTLGGVLAIMGIKGNENDVFWRIAAYVDTHGIHKLQDWPYFEGMRRLEYWDDDESFDYDRVADAQADLDFYLPYLNAFWAWSESNRLFAPRDGAAQDCTAFFMNAVAAITAILAEDPELAPAPYLAAGEAWAAAKDRLEADSFVTVRSGVILRESPQFVNHLYCHSGKSYKAVVAFNPEKLTVTVSLADPLPGVSCREIVQALWGPEAGGHDGIAGGPRNIELPIDEAARCMAAMAEAVAAAS